MDTTDNDKLDEAIATIFAQTLIKALCDKPIGKRAMILIDPPTAHELCTTACKIALHAARTIRQGPTP